MAVLFPGQGCQFVGMLSRLLKESPTVRRMVNIAEEILSFPLGKLIEEGPVEQLTLTEYAQPAIVLTSLCHWDLFLQRNPHGNITCVAGHSVGEYSALTAAGIFSFDQAMTLAVRLCFRVPDL